MSRSPDDLVDAILASTDPEMRHVNDHPYLQRRVRVSLDGADVTRLCRAFSVPTGRVLLMVEDERGRKLLSYTCACGTIRGGPVRPKFCAECVQHCDVGVVEDLRSGSVVVVRA